MSVVTRYENAHKLVEVVDAIRMRPGSILPSEDVQLKALRLMETPGATSRNVGPATVYNVKGEHGTYKVILYGSSIIVNAECTCPATTVCSHMLVALAKDDRKLAV